MRFFLLRSTLFCSLTLCACSAIAQISFGGRPTGFDDRRGEGNATVTFPAVDAERLLAEDEARELSGAKGPRRFGVNHETSLNNYNSGMGIAFPDGTSAWRVVLHCPGAKSINLVFGEFILTEGDRVFVWNEAGDVLGAFTQASSGGQHSLGVDALPGNRITVQLEHAPGSYTGGGSLRITQVTHGYRGFGDERGLGDSGSCNVNTICPQGDPWRDQIASVAMITVNGNGHCTGQLINNCANNGTPYFLTANHCLSGQNPATWVFRFNWESPGCNPTTGGPTGNTVSGSTLLASDAGSDVALLLLNTAPPASYNAWYTGWDATGETPASTTVIHHPTGDVKKISFDHDASAQSEFGGAQCWHVLAWEEGTTEFGSSGSGLWNPDGRLIGQLYGGEANCLGSINDHFGRFDLSYPLLSSWLGTCQPPVLDGYDPNTPLPALDASLLTITGIEPSYCNSGTISPAITFRNNGTSTLTQLTIAHAIDGGTPTIINWTGSVLSGQTETIAIGDLDVASGAHVFTTTCSAPNGGVDGYAANDDKSVSFFIANPGALVTINITLDDYGSETTWQLTEEGGPVILSGGPYADDSAGMVVSTEICLGTGCYVLTLSDSYGDGICCQFGPGDFEVVDDGGTVLLDGNGEFQATVSGTFCPVVGMNEIMPHGVFQVFPNPGDGSFRITYSDARGGMRMIARDALGREVWRSDGPVRTGELIDLSRLPSGTYALESDGGAGSRAMIKLVIAR